VKLTIGCLETAGDVPEEQEHQYDQHEYSKDAGGRVTPIAAVVPSGQAAKEQNDQYT
jgi:hypothetical protein